MPSVNLGRVSIVPKGAWSNSNSYEKLDVVTYGGGSYIANKDVPAGTSLSTTEYWSNFVGALSLGTVETVSASTGASAELITTSTGQTLNLSIPRGVAGNESIDDTAGIGDTDYVWSADKTQTEINNVQNNIEGKANAIEKTASGDIVSFDDGADNQYIKSLKVNIEPVQDLHGYDYPWPEGGGKNVFEPTIVNDASSVERNGVTMTLKSNGYYHFQGTNEATGGRGNFKSKNFTIKAGTYYKNLFGDSSKFSAIWQYANGTVVGYDNPMTFSEDTVVNIGINVSVTGAYDDDIAVSITKDESETSYSPYANICPITGWTEATVKRSGKNLLFVETEPTSTSEVSVTKNADGSYTFTKLQNIANSYSKSVFGGINNKKVIKLKAGTTYYITDVNVQINGVSKGTFQTPLLYTAQEGDYINYCWFWINNQTFENIFGGNTYTAKPMIQELATSKNDYVPWIDNAQVTIDLDGTRYGGILDVTNGKMLVTMGYADLGDLTWTYSEQRKWFYNYSIGIKTYTTNAICSNYPYVTAPNLAEDLTIDKAFSANGTSLVVRDLAYTDPATFKTAISGVQLVYELATPITITLTSQQLSTLLGENHIWADSGDIEVTYRVETKDYVDNIIDDTAGDGDTDKVWSADKSYAVASAIDDELSDMVEGLLDEYLFSTNLFDYDSPDNVDGYIASNGNISSNANYKTSGFIRVKPSTKYYVAGGWKSGYGFHMVPFLLEYTSGKVPSTYHNEVLTSFTTGATTEYVRFTYRVATSRNKIGITELEIPVNDIVPAYNRQVNARKTSIPQAQERVIMYKNDSVNKKTIIGVTGLTFSPRKNSRIAFSASFSTFTSLKIGLQVYGGTEQNKLEIDTTKVTAYNYNGDTTEYTHGLTITNNIQILLEIGFAMNCNLTLVSNGQTFTQSNIRWDGKYNTYPFVYCQTDLTDVVLSWTSKDMNKSIWMFGDSYFGYTNHWAYHLNQSGYIDNCMMDSYPGKGSADAIKALKTYLQYAVPQKVVWCMGMNDGSDTDETTPSSNWQTAFDELITLSNAFGFDIVVATIPTVPEIYHVGQNYAARNSGYRVIDFAAAVGANADGNWFSDMLSTDNVHPTATGAKALYMRFIADFPEIMISD